MNSLLVQRWEVRTAADAVEVDTTHLSLTEVVDRMVDLARDRGLVVPEGQP